MYYGDKHGKYELYDDDGETFDYEKGAYSWREIRVENRKGTISDPVKGKPNTIKNITWKFMTPPTSKEE
jgi:alpha-D-xyloside xylohydrolase